MLGTLCTQKKLATMIGRRFAVCLITLRHGAMQTDTCRSAAASESIMEQTSKEKDAEGGVFTD